MPVATAATVPENIRQAMRLLIAHWFEQREGALVTPGSNAVVLPYGIDSLLGLYQQVGV